MANGWTENRKKAQREAIQRWRPWEKSTGPKSAAGKRKVSRNAVKHGFRCRGLLRELRAVRKFLKGCAGAPWEVR